MADEVICVLCLRPITQEQDGLWVDSDVNLPWACPVAPFDRFGHLPPADTSDPVAVERWLAS